MVYGPKLQDCSKIPEDHAETCPKWFMKLVISIKTFGSPFG
jgi:hypothetical protein